MDNLINFIKPSIDVLKSLSDLLLAPNSQSKTKLLATLIHDVEKTLLSIDDPDVKKVYVSSIHKFLKTIDNSIILDALFEKYNNKYIGSPNYVMAKGSHIHDVNIRNSTIIIIRHPDNSYTVIVPDKPVHFIYSKVTDFLAFWILLPFFDDVVSQNTHN